MERRSAKYITVTPVIPLVHSSILLSATGPVQQPADNFEMVNNSQVVLPLVVKAVLPVKLLNSMTLSSTMLKKETYPSLSLVRLKRSYRLVLWELLNAEKIAL
jgi:hypothetical protein